MMMKINGKRFFVSDTEMYGLSVTYLCFETEKEYVLISCGSNKWSASQLVNRLAGYSEMSARELRNIAKEVIG